MPCDRVNRLLKSYVDELTTGHSRKGLETVFEKVVEPTVDKGPRFRLKAMGDRNFLRMNSNSYLGLSLQRDIIVAEEDAVRACGTGPGAVRFISGTWAMHTELEQTLAAFHQREAAMLFSSAYATMMGVLPALITDSTAVISDALNHNCIINAISLGKPTVKSIYPHLEMIQLESALAEAVTTCDRAIIVTDGIFSMRGDHAPLKEIMALAGEYDVRFSENVLVVVDDSHGVGAFGKHGRGTEEYTDSPQVDLLIGTLGKAFGVNGGYVTGPASIIDYLREVSPFYIYSNPITPGEAAAAHRAVNVVDSDKGQQLLTTLRQRTHEFEQGVKQLGFETIASEHPVVPLMIRDTGRTTALVRHLFNNNILATGITYPVVPEGDEEIRFQVSADHTEDDIAEVLDALGRFTD